MERQAIARSLHIIDLSYSAMLRPHPSIYARIPPCQTDEAAAEQVLRLSYAWIHCGHISNSMSRCLVISISTCSSCTFRISSANQGYAAHKRVAGERLDQLLHDISLHLFFSRADTSHRHTISGIQRVKQARGRERVNQLQKRLCRDILGVSLISTANKGAYLQNHQ